MPARRRDVGFDAHQRWADLRKQSAVRQRELLDSGPSGVLDALAWKAGTALDGQFSFDNDLRERIEKARAERYTWREIAAALGEGDDDDAARRVADQQKWRNRAYRRAGSHDG
jgi:hypothetical protein